MRLARHIGMAMLCTLLGLLLPQRVAAMAHDAYMCSATTHCIEGTDDAKDDGHDAPSFTVSSAVILPSSTPTVTPPSVTPAVRTISRTAPSSERMFQHSKAVRAIDSTTAAMRYGLYNDKILFETHSRHYYLNRLMRLII